ncbi:MAG TPA: 23S rRNA (uracil(1939)-C(5))-methyltransferase RlmD, partial [Deltaproteobacteria bacterium]|nr:23S rRNA (uracil(1939)-C(5))-methyltransferase RlmD [Deltaproteobacteria bacterium]
MPLPHIQVVVENLNSQGHGVARHEGKVYFIPWAVPGDTVTIQVEKDHKKYADACLITINKPSPDRIKPECPYFFKCGGCD